MATDQDNTSIQELLCYEDDGSRYYSGTKAQFVDTGKFKPEWFPGVKGNNKTLMTIERNQFLSSGFDPLIAKLQITRNEESRNLFDIEMRFTDEESERRSQIHAKELEYRAYKEASSVAKRWIDGMPASIEGFKKHSAWLINEMIMINFNEGSLNPGGYSFDKKTVREFNLVVEVLCNTLLNGKVNFYPFGHEQKRRDLAAEAFNRGLCLSFTGHQRNALVDRFLDEMAASKADAAHA